ncbi:hypothetical protein D3C78_1011400 [compost metagenome]
MIAVAVGRLHQHHVGLAQRGRVAHQRRAGVAQVTGEHQAAGQAVVMHFQFDDGRAEDVPGIVEGHADAARHFYLVTVQHRATQLERQFGVGFGVQRYHRLAAEACAPLVFPLGVIFLNVRGIHQHQLQQVAGGIRRIDRAAVALRGQAGEQAAMVDVGMGDHHGIQLQGIEGEGLAVVGFVFAAALTHAALKQDACAVTGLDQVAGAGDLLDGAEKGKKSHEKLLVANVATACQGAAGP